jgi:prepilin-type N-terminal cleavage/methylation domain-containing protein
MQHRIDSISPRRGFTLIEILVVIGILVLLAGVLLPVTLRAMRAGERTRMAADLQAIAVALEAYKTDHGDYPRVAGDPGDTDYLTGAQILCRALVAPGPALQPGGAAEPVADGADGPGFRVRASATPQGRVHGPYLQADRFRLRDPADLKDLTTVDPENLNLVMIDQSDQPILYFPARPGKLNLNLSNAYVDEEDTSRFDIRDATIPPNVSYFRQGTEGDNVSAILRIQSMLGDPDANGAILDGASTATHLPFLLWSAGPDAAFGPETVVAGDAAANTKAAIKCDDVTNFNVAP